MPEILEKARIVRQRHRQHGEASALNPKKILPDLESDPAACSPAVQHSWRINAPMRRSMGLPDDIAELGAELDKTMVAGLGRAARYKAHEVLGSIEEPGDHLLLVRSGIAVRVRLGSAAKQILAIRYAGEAIFPHERAVNPGVMMIVPSEILKAHADILPAALDRAELTALYIRALQRSEQIACEWILRGQMSGPARVAHFLCEFAERNAVDQSVSFSLPFTQAQLGAITGQTTVHVNRVLRDLERDGVLVRKSVRSTTFDADWHRLRRIGNFTPQYLQ